MNYNDNGTIKSITVKAGDTLPVGTEVNFEGSTVPAGWVEVDDSENVSISTILTLASSFNVASSSIKKEGNHYFGYITITKSSKFTGSQETVATLNKLLTYNINMFAVGGEDVADIYDIPVGIAYVYIEGQSGQSNGTIYIKAPNTFEYVKFYLDMILKED